MKPEIIDKSQQYLFILNNLYKEYYQIPKNDTGGYHVDESGKDEEYKSCFDRPLYVRYESIGKIGRNAPMEHIGEKAQFSLYFDKDGNFELLFENNGYVDEVKSFKHLMWLLDPKTLDLN